MSTTYSNIELETVDKSNKAPENRIKDCNTARGIYSQLLQSYRDGRGEMNVLVKRALDGNPPYDQDEMDKLGMSDCSNLNFRLLESDIVHASNPYYSMFREIPNYIECKVELGSANERSEYARIFAEEHKNLMDRWKGFDHAHQLSSRGRVTFGSGPLYFTDEDDFRFQYAAEGTILYPSLTKLDIDCLELLFITCPESITNLWSITQNKKAKDAGWNVDEIKKVLISSQDSKQQSNTSSQWEEFQTKIRHNDLGMAMQVKPVDIVHVFIKEFDKKITHCILTVDAASSNYIFQRKGRFTNWRQIVHPMFADIGDGYWGGVKGIGVKSYNFRDTQNRLKNRFVDAAMKASQILAQPSSPEAMEEFQMVSMGPMATVPPGVNFVANPLSASIDKPVVIDNMLENDLARNTAGYRQGKVNSSGNAISATEATIDAQKQDSLSLQQVNQALSQMDDLYEEQVKRLCKPVTTQGDWQQMVKEFQLACVSRGFPRLAFSRVKNVKAYRPIGQGSRFERNQILGTLMGMTGLMPQDVKIRVLRDMIASVAGQSYLESIWPKEQLTIGPTTQEAEAQLENGMFNQGLPAIVTQNQDHVAHASIHIAFVLEKANVIKKALAEDPEQGKIVLLTNSPDLLKIAEVAAPHVQQHMALMWQDKKRSPETQQVFNAFEQAFAYVTQIAQQYGAAKKAIDKQNAQAQQPTQGASQSEMDQLNIKNQIEWLKVQQDEARKNFIAQQDVERENKKAIAKIQQDMAKAQQDKFINDAVGAEKVKTERVKRKKNAIPTTQE